MKTIKLPLQKAYPKRLHFANEEYRVIFKKNMDCYGETDAERKTITIKDGLSPRALLETFIHEVLHMFEFEHPIALKHSDVYKLEKAIMEFMMDNFL